MSLIRQLHPGRRYKKEEGFSLVEILVSLTLFSVLALNLLHSTVLSHRTAIRARRNSAAAQVALERMEQLSAVDPETLIGFNGESMVETRYNVTFTRTVAVAIEADRTRTVNVSVTNPNPETGGTATLTGSFALWGKR